MLNLKNYGASVEELKEDRKELKEIRGDYIKLLGTLEEFAPEDLAMIKLFQEEGKESVVNHILVSNNNQSLKKSKNFNGIFIKHKYGTKKPNYPSTHRVGQFFVSHFICHIFSL